MLLGEIEQFQILDIHSKWLNDLSKDLLPFTRRIFSQNQFSCHLARKVEQVLFNFGSFQLEHFEPGFNKTVIFSSMEIYPREFHKLLWNNSSYSTLK